MIFMLRKLRASYYPMRIYYLNRIRMMRIKSFKENFTNSNVSSQNASGSKNISFEQPYRNVYNNSNQGRGRDNGHRNALGRGSGKQCQFC